MLATQRNASHHNGVDFSGKCQTVKKNYWQLTRWNFNDTAGSSDVIRRRQMQLVATKLFECERFQAECGRFFQIFLETFIEFGFIGIWLLICCIVDVSFHHSNRSLKCHIHELLLYSTLIIQINCLNYGYLWKNNRFSLYFCYHNTFDALTLSFYRTWVLDTRLLLLIFFLSSNLFVLLWCARGSSI